MDRRTRNLFALMLVAVIVITGGAALVLGGSGLVDPDDPGGRRTMDGVIVGVDSAGLSDVRGFTLRRADGGLVEFRLATLENGAEFPPGHLAEHQATADPVRVTYVDEGEALLAVRLEDAPAG